MINLHADAEALQASMERSQASLAKWLEANRCAVMEAADAVKCHKRERTCVAREGECRRREG
jgi:hypothetical protein